MIWQRDSALAEPHERRYFVAYWGGGQRFGEGNS